MTQLIITIFAIYGLSFLIKDSSGPWDLCSKTRNVLMNNRFVGVFFFKLFDCYFCVGCHSGWIVYLLTQEHYHFNFLICWSLAGGIISLMLDALLTKLQE
jgi:hypothetical protein